MESPSRRIVDRSTLTLLEHVNINVPSHEYILPFYFILLGCGLDPRKARNLDQNAKKKTLWANCGASQFHLPYGETAQCIPGMIGLKFDSLAGLEERLLATAGEAGVKESRVETDDAGNKSSIRLVDYYGNVFLCRAGGNPVSDPSLVQPIISPVETEAWGSIASTYGRETTDCKGIDFVEFKCPLGVADRIALFYESVLDATTSVVEDKGSKVAMIAFGNIDESGKADQYLIFRETQEEIPQYDGHHIAMYVGESAADFEQAFKNAKMAGVVWVNPRFSDKAHTLQGAKDWKQFRFKDIVDMETGKKIFELEHEMRSIEHEAWPCQRA